MLFTKKNRFLVNEKQFKEDLLDEKNELLLKINLRYPEIKCKRKDVLSGSCATLYPKMADALIHNAKSELRKAAAEAKKANPDGFLPFAVLMNFENVFESERLLCIIVDISVSDGRNPPEIERKIQIWEREFGTKCRFSYFFKHDSHKKIKQDFVPEELQKGFDRELFAYREDGFEFHIRRKNGYRTVMLPFSVAKENEFLKI